MYIKCTNDAYLYVQSAYGLYSYQIHLSTKTRFWRLCFVLLRLIRPTPGIKPGGRIEVFNQ